MVGEQLRIIGITHASANLRINSASVANLRSLSTKNDRRTHILKLTLLINESMTGRAALGV